jgi:hypothetical protein
MVEARKRKHPLAGEADQSLIEDGQLMLQYEPNS